MKWVKQWLKSDNVGKSLKVLFTTDVNYDDRSTRAERQGKSGACADDTHDGEEESPSAWQPITEDSRNKPKARLHEAQNRHECGWPLWCVSRSIHQLDLSRQKVEKKKIEKGRKDG